MTKKHILEEIKRTAEANNGKTLGQDRFFQQTGIQASDWEGVHWVRWSDAIRGAGYEPNTLCRKYDETHLLEKLIAFIRELDHFPVRNELKLKRRSDPDFPSWNVFPRLGSRSQLAAKIIAHCRSSGAFEDVVALCEPLLKEDEAQTSDEEAQDLGFVYLLKSGRFYKIGRSNAAGRRERELAIQLPEKANNVHVIRTDDPIGIEAYWHNRFSAKRRNGEWFELDASDIKAFRRRKGFM